MGIIDDIQQLQMQRVQQAAQQQGFAQPDAAPEPPQQSQSQVGNSFSAAQPQPDSGQAGRLQAGMADYANMLLQQAQQLTQPKPQSAWQRARQGFSDAGMHYVGLPTSREKNIQNMGVEDQALKTAVGVQQSGVQQQQLDLQRQQVTLPNGMVMPLALAKTLAPALFRAQTSDTNNQRNNDTKKLLAGYNDDGSVKPLTSLSIPQQLKAQATDALNRLNKARTDALNADPNTGAGQLALSKLQISEQMARASLTRAAAQSGMENIAAQKFAKDYIDGMQDENGNPMGLKQAALNLPTADRQRRGDLAANAQHNLDQIKAIIERRPDIFGKIGGSVAHLDDLLGSNDPDIRAIAVLGDQYALPSVGAHGLRAKGAVQQVKDDLLRSMRGGPEGFKGAYDAASSSFGSLINDQQLGKRARPMVGAGSSNNGAPLTFTDGGKTYRILPKDKAAFLKDHPNAR